MQASDRGGIFRLPARLIGGLMVAALASLALAASSGAAEPPHKTYLALGDSVAFGYSQQLFNENFPGEDPHKFGEGYVSDYLNALVAKQTKASQWQVPATNDGCPGETTGSMIGNKILAAQMAKLGAVGEAPCAYHEVTKFHLHHEYGGQNSQLEDALHVIQSHNHDVNPGNPVSLVTLGIGSNDELHAIGKCEAEVKAEFEAAGKSKYAPGEPEAMPPVPPGTPEEAVGNCILVHFHEIATAEVTNIGAILYTLRNGSQFCFEVPTTPCDAGHKGVNYLGKIDFVAEYDPYGAVFTPFVEVKPGTNLLLLILNQLKQKVAESAAACFVNPQPVFNPLLQGKGTEEPETLQKLTNMANFSYATAHPYSEGHGELTVGSRLVKNVGGLNNGLKSASELKVGMLVKVHNATDPHNLVLPAGTTVTKIISGTEVEVSNMAEKGPESTSATRNETLEFDAKNGPDIHPTPLGYSTLSNVIGASCP